MNIRRSARNAVGKTGIYRLPDVNLLHQVVPGRILFKVVYDSSGIFLYVYGFHLSFLLMEGIIASIDRDGNYFFRNRWFYPSFSTIRISSSVML